MRLKVFLSSLWQKPESKKHTYGWRREEQSVSQFDVGGKNIQKGLKGFVYGERGVWRPGDTLHISFMLEDRNNRIPDKHPVALEIYNPRGQFYNKLISTNGVNGCILSPYQQEQKILPDYGMLT